MVLLRFTGFLLCLLCVLHAPRGSAAYAYKGGKVDRNGLIVTGQNVEEFRDDVSSTVARKMKLRGRKTMADEAPRKEIEKKEELKGESSKISGKDVNTWKRTGSSQDHSNNQNIENKSHMLEPTASKSTSHISSDKRRHSEDSRAVSTKGSLNRTSSRSNKQPRKAAQKDESQRLLEAADDEIVNLMKKDYRGADGPRRKPPINNQKPND